MGGAGNQRRVRVEPELVQVADVKTAQTTWEQPFDEQQSDVYKLQSNIAERVATALKVQLNPAERSAIAQPSTQNPEAYLAYLRGAALEQSSVPEDEARARTEYRRAVTLDSTFVDAWNALSLSITRWAARHPTTPAFDDSARTAAEHALAIDPKSADATGNLAFYHEIIKHDMRRAHAGYLAVIALSPNKGEWLGELSSNEMRLGMWDSAITHSERSVQFNPRSAFVSNTTGNAYLLVRRYADAGRECKRAAGLRANNMLTVFCLIQVPLAQGDLGAARATVRAASPGIDSLTLYVFLASYGAYTWVLDESQKRALLTLPPKAFDRGRSAWALTRMLLYDELGEPRLSRAYADSAALALQAENAGAAADSDSDYGLALAYAGRRTDAIAAADGYLKLHPIEGDFLDGPDNAESSIKAYVRAGAADKALDLLERLLRIPGRLTPGRLRIDPSFGPLHDNPRFQRLIASKAAGE
jgi:tetratricopeptide (TPR) repeat protein